MGAKCGFHMYCNLTINVAFFRSYLAEASAGPNCEAKAHKKGSASASGHLK